MYSYDYIITYMIILVCVMTSAMHNSDGRYKERWDGMTGDGDDVTG